MKVRELIKFLKGFDKEAIVIMSQDSEGNGFSPLNELTAMAYTANNSWSGEVGLTELTPELEANGYSEDDVVVGEACVVLWPMN